MRSKRTSERVSSQATLVGFAFSSQSSPKEKEVVERAVARRLIEVAPARQLLLPALTPLPDPKEKILYQFLGHRPGAHELQHEVAQLGVAGPEQVREPLA